MKICVTHEDIVKGQDYIKSKSQNFLRGLRSNCAIARAIQRITNDSEAYWYFGSGHANGKIWKAKRYTFVTKWVKNHDKGKKVKPFNFIVKEIEKQ